MEGILEEDFSALYSDRRISSPALKIEATRENFPYMYVSAPYKDAYSPF